MLRASTGWLVDDVRGGVLGISAGFEDISAWAGDSMYQFGYGLSVPVL
jgi:hypothetical protein